MSLRRAVSASYYALFHMPVDEAARLMIAGRDRSALRDCLARALDHVDLAERAFADWRGIRRTPQADTFLAGLLACGNMRG